MGIFSQIKSFVGSIIKNPIKSIAISFLVYKLLKSHAKKESLEETVKILKKGKSNDLIFDTNTKTYIIVSHDGSTAKGFPDETSARKAFPESVKMEKLFEACAEIVTPAKEEDVDPEQLKLGIEVEMEHTDSPEEAKKIALQHLAEVQDYYTKLNKYVEPSSEKLRILYESVIGE